MSLRVGRSAWSHRFSGVGVIQTLRNEESAVSLEAAWTLHWKQLIMFHTVSKHRHLFWWAVQMHPIWHVLWAVMMMLENIRCGLYEGKTENYRVIMPSRKQAGWRMAEDEGQMGWRSLMERQNKMKPVTAKEEKRRQVLIALVYGRKQRCLMWMTRVMIVA